ncbi:MAG: DUF3189 family protein [Chitinophagales bacterium]
MKIIYHCFGGSHSSVVSACIHLGLLPASRLPSNKELMALPLYDKTKSGDYGNIKYMGNDNHGNQIYILAKKHLGGRLNNVLNGLAELVGVKDQMIAVNTIPYINWAMMLGGFTSRRLGLPWLGRPVLFWGTRRAFFNLTSLVQAIKMKLI